MKTIIKTKEHGEICYEENFWTGSKKISIDGVPAQKLSRKQFSDSEGRLLTVSGNFYSGFKLSYDREVYELSPALKWYELVLILLPIMLNFTWGNNRVLCNIIPSIGGAIGGAIGAGLCGAISALGAFLGGYFMRNTRKVLYKILIGLGAFVASFGICVLVGFLYVA